MQQIHLERHVKIISHSIQEKSLTYLLFIYSQGHLKVNVKVAAKIKVT